MGKFLPNKSKQKVPEYLTKKVVEFYKIKPKHCFGKILDEVWQINPNKRSQNILPQRYSNFPKSSLNITLGKVFPWNYTSWKIIKQKRIKQYGNIPWEIKKQKWNIPWQRMKQIETGMKYPLANNETEMKYPMARIETYWNRNEMSSGK